MRYTINNRIRIDVCRFRVSSHITPWDCRLFVRVVALLWLRLGPLRLLPAPVTGGRPPRRWWFYIN